MILNETVEYYLQNIFNHEYLKECFELRIALANENRASKTEFEKNETELLIYRTKVTQASLENKLKEVNDEFKDTLRIFFDELEELRTKEDAEKDGSNLLDYK